MIKFPEMVRFTQVRSFEGQLCAWGGRTKPHGINFFEVSGASLNSDSVRIEAITPLHDGFSAG